MNEEQTVFEQFTLSDLKKWSSTVLNNFDNSTIIITNDSDEIIS